VPAGVDVVGGDLELPESLTPALAGVRSVFLLGGWGDMPGLLLRIQSAGVERVVLLTSRCVVGGRADNAVTRMWLDSEAAVRGSGLAWTILRPSGYQSNALRWLPQLAEGDAVRAAWPDVAIAAIDPADIGEVAAVALTERGHEGAAHTLSGPEALTPGGVRDLGRRFERLYADRYGEESLPSVAGLELVTFVVEARGVLPRPELREHPLAGPDPGAAELAPREAFDAATREVVETAVYDGALLRPGNAVTGPAVVEYPASTVVLSSGQVAVVDALLDLSIRRTA